jgi:hypothetical protein
MAATFRGRINWSMNRDRDGYRTYRVVHLVKCDIGDGPAIALLCPGLPVPGSYYLIDNDSDSWAYCTQEAQVSPHQQKGADPVEFWAVEQSFSTKPYKRCSEFQVEDPLMEPPKIQVTFSRTKEEATHDKNGLQIKNSAHEVIRGPQVEFDVSRISIRIEQNLLDSQADLISAGAQAVNLNPIWGFPTRSVKLSEVSIEKQYHGPCYIYYKRSLTFEVNTRLYQSTFDVIDEEDVDWVTVSGYTIVSGWDRHIVDEGAKALRGTWQHDPNSIDYGQYILDSDIRDSSTAKDNPKNFIRFKDWNGENARTLLSQGRPYDPGSGTPGATGSGTGPDITPGEIFVQKYDELDFLLLNVPVTL